MVTTRPFGIVAPLCTICGKTLGLHERAAGPVCGDLRCRTVLAVRADEARMLRRTEAMAAATERIRQLEGALDPAAEARVGIVPFADGPFAPPDPARIALFRLSLETAMAGALGREASRPAGGTAPTPDNRAPAPPEAVAAGCSSCRGLCCERGGTHAFLSEDEMARKLVQGRDAGPGDLAEAYLARLPPLSAIGGCVFQAPDGCSLPRELRSSVCNDYLCGGLVRWLAALAPDASPRAWIVSMDGIAPRRAAAIEAGGMRALPAAP